MLEVKNVSYAYKTKKDKTILNNVSATFEEGIFYTIVGPSGAGKTTLLSLLAGLDTAVKGTVLCNGEDITKKGLNVSVLVLITASVLVSGIVILKRNPKDILSEMS